MIIRVIRIFVKPESISAFEAATVENHRASIAEAGIIRFDFLRDQTTPGEYLLYEVYHDQAAAAAHKETGHYKEWKSAVALMMAKDRESQAYTALAPAEWADPAASG